MNLIRRRNRTNLVVASGIGLLLSGCNTTAPMEVYANVTVPVFEEIDASENKASFALAKLVNDIDKGDPILAFPANPPTKGSKCNLRYTGDNTVTYVGGEKLLGNWSTDLGEAFYDTLSGMGYSVAGDPKDLFDQAAGVRSAEYLVGGRLVQMSGNFCHAHSWWDGRPLKRYSGEMAVTFEWSVLNTLTKEVVLTERSDGYFKLDETLASGVAIVFENAFADAAKAFASNSDMRKLATGEKLASLSETVPLERSYAIETGDEPVLFDIASLRPLIVTIRVGQGHGSGFFIGKGGYLLTNAHVVGKAKQVQIITAQGLEITGEVIESDAVRDVALIKSPIKVSNPIPVQISEPGIAETVYAVGTPIHEALRTTVTKGIVSAMRRDPASGLLFIQSDAAISPGNSGGPLLNEKGEVIGISVLKVDQAEGLGLFIPISDALAKLGITVG